VIQTIVFAPLIAAILAGFANRAFGTVLPKALTTGALFLACVLSWAIFLPFLGGDVEATVAPVLPGCNRATWRSTGRFAWTR